MWLRIVLVGLFGCANALVQLPSPLILGGVLTGNRMAGVPLGMTLGDGELDVEGICSKPGFACSNCTHAITCVRLPVGYLKVPLDKCPDDQTCNGHQNQCSDQHVPECQKATQLYQHTCEQVGIFPDAHDCRKFHLCSPPDGVPFGRPADHRTAFCPRHYGYNPLTAQCSIKLANGQCSNKLVPECTKVGQTGPLSMSPNHYYVCLIKKGNLYPQIFLCPHGWFFLDGFCQPNDEAIADNPRAEGKAVVTETVRASDDKTSESTEKEEEHIATEETTVKSTTSRIESFFSTEKAITFAPDAFLADKFDLTNYESTDDVTPYNSNYNSGYSFESTEFW